MFPNKDILEWLDSEYGDIMKSAGKDGLRPDEVMVLALKAQINHFEHLNNDIRGEISSTKDAVDDLKGELKKTNEKIDSVRNEVKVEIQEMRQDIKDVRGEMKGIEQTLRGEIKEVEQTLRGEIKHSEDELRYEITRSFALFTEGLTPRLKNIERFQFCVAAGVLTVVIGYGAKLFIT